MDADEPEPKPRYILYRAAGENGLTVREGKELDSQELTEKLGFGAIICQLQEGDNRVRYFLLDGVGPQTGWVTRSNKNRKRLVEQMEEEEQRPLSEDELRQIEKILQPQVQEQAAEGPAADAPGERPLEPELEADREAAAAGVGDEATEDRSHQVPPPHPGAHQGVQDTETEGLLEEKVSPRLFDAPTPSRAIPSPRTTPRTAGERRAPARAHQLPAHSKDRPQGPGADGRDDVETINEAAEDDRGGDHVWETDGACQLTAVDHPGEAASSSSPARAKDSSQDDLSANRYIVHNTMEQFDESDKRKQKEDIETSPEEAIFQAERRQRALLRRKPKKTEEERLEEERIRKETEEVLANERRARQELWRRFEKEEAEKKAVLDKPSNSATAVDAKSTVRRYHFGYDDEYEIVDFGCLFDGNVSAAWIEKDILHVYKEGQVAKMPAFQKGCGDPERKPNFQEATQLYGAQLFEKGVSAVFTDEEDNLYVITKERPGGRVRERPARRFTGQIVEKRWVGVDKSVGMAFLFEADLFLVKRAYQGWLVSKVNFGTDETPKEEGRWPMFTGNVKTAFLDSRSEPPFLYVVRDE